MSGSESDDDYIDIGDVAPDDIREDFTEDIPDKEPSNKGRGEDIKWIEMARYPDKATYKNSAYFLDIAKYFSKRKSCENDYSDNDHYTCKFSRKRVFLKCPLQYKVHFVNILLKSLRFRVMILKVILSIIMLMMRRRVKIHISVPFRPAKSY